jgi:hypothetical protein
MGSCLDQRTVDIKVVHDFEGPGVAKEYARASVGNDTTVASGGGADMNAATKGAESGEVGEDSAAHFVGAGRARAVRDTIVKAKVMIEGIRPKTGLEAGAG